MIIVLVIKMVFGAMESDGMLYLMNMLYTITEGSIYFSHIVSDDDNKMIFFDTSIQTSGRKKILEGDYLSVFLNQYGLLIPLIKQNV